MGINGGEKSPEAVFVIHGKGEPFVPGKPRQTVPAGAVFGKGMDIGIIPEQVGLYSLIGQGRNAVDRTGRAAGMK